MYSTELGWTVTSRIVFGGASQFTIFTGYKVEQIVPLYGGTILCHGPPRLSSPPEAHVYGGVVSVLGLQVLKS